MFGLEVCVLYTETYFPVITWLTGICCCVAVVIILVYREITYKEFDVTNNIPFAAYKISKFRHSHGDNDSNYEENRLKYQGLTKIILSQIHSANLKSHILFGKQIIKWSSVQLPRLVKHGMECIQHTLLCNIIVLQLDPHASCLQVCQVNSLVTIEWNPYHRHPIV